jgi:L-asparagine transporter-like permease
LVHFSVRAFLLGSVAASQAKAPIASCQTSAKEVALRIPLDYVVVTPMLESDLNFAVPKQAMSRVVGLHDR